MQLVILNWWWKLFLFKPSTRNLEFYILISFIFKQTKKKKKTCFVHGFFSMLWGVMFEELFNGCSCKTWTKNNNGLVAHAKDKHTWGHTCNATSWMKNSNVVNMQTHKECTIWRYQTQCWLLPHCDSNLCVRACAYVRVHVRVSMNVNTCTACMDECVWTPIGCDSVQVYMCVTCFCFTKRLPQYFFVLKRARQIAFF